MKRKRTFFLCGLATALLALSALPPPLLNGASATQQRGTLFVWNDGGDGHSWAVEDNWVNGNGYPSSIAHGAKFPDNSGTAWEVDLFTATIGQMTIEESVLFNGASSNPGPALAMNSLIIDPADGEVTVTIDGYFEFTANEPPP